jgi:hypothetical protein
MLALIVRAKSEGVIISARILTKERELMSYGCTTLGSLVRLQQFEWYIFLLQDGLSDQLRTEIETNFDRLGQIVGENAVVIRGYDPQGFRREVHEAYGGMYPRLQEVSPPALFVTDVPPARLGDAKAAGRFIVFPLRGFRREDGSVADFLSSLADALADPEAIAALEQSPPGLFERRWQWLNRYLTMRPAFMGFSADLGAVGGDVARCLDRWFPAAHPA